MLNSCFSVSQPILSKNQCVNSFMQQATLCGHKTLPLVMKADSEDNIETGIAKSSFSICDEQGYLFKLTFHHSRISNQSPSISSILFAKYLLNSHLVSIDSSNNTSSFFFFFSEDHNISFARSLMISIQS